MKLILLLLFLVNSFYASSQRAATDKHAKESELLVLINEVRTNPKKFLTANALPYLIENDEDTVQNNYVVSLLKELRKQKPMSPLQGDSYLHTQSHAFAEDMGKTGATGHESKRLGSFEKRLKKYANKEIGENCDYGSDDPMVILMDLLIDDGVPGVGHRRNLLNAHYKLIGIGIEPHKEYEWNCVMDFSS